MARLEQHPSSGHFKIKKNRKLLSVAESKAAEVILLRFEENVALLERERLELHPNGDIKTFCYSMANSHPQQGPRRCSQKRSAKSWTATSLL